MTRLTYTLDEVSAGRGSPLAAVVELPRGWGMDFSLTGGC